MQRQHLLKTMTRAIPILLGVLWLGGVIKGMSILWDYQNAPGKAGASPAHWPSQSQVPHSPDRATLVMMVHPHCPCSRSTLGELALLMTRLQGRMSATVLFYKPTGLGANWEKTDLWKSAAVIPGVTVLRDDDGIEARRFGASTSGQTVVYDQTGRLVFSGGITSSRGHLGDNAGVQTIVSRILYLVSGRQSTPVYGCSLETPSRRTSWKR